LARENLFSWRTKLIEGGRDAADLRRFAGGAGCSTFGPLSRAENEDVIGRGIFRGRIKSSPELFLIQNDRRRRWIGGGFEYRRNSTPLTIASFQLEASEMKQPFMALTQRSHDLVVRCC
jgi:hypothetical protein